MTSASFLAVLLGSTFLVSILTLAATIRILRSSRRSEAVGENRYELMSEQRDRLMVLHEERQTLLDELERQDRERQELVELLGKNPSQLADDLKKVRVEHLEAQERIEDVEQERLRLEQELQQFKDHLEQERQAHLEAQQQAEHLQRQQREQSSIQQKLERLGEERKRLTEDLEKEREERSRAERRADSQEQERTRQEEELRILRAELDSLNRTPAHDPVNELEATQTWYRRPLPVIGLLLSALLLWLVSLMTALYVLTA